MLTVKDHNDRAVAAYAAVSGQHWIEAVKDGRHVLIRPLAEKDREREYAFIKRLSPELNKQAIQLDVLQRLVSFAQARFPQHLTAMVELLEPFGEELAKVK